MTPTIINTLNFFREDSGAEVVFLKLKDRCHYVYPCGNGLRYETIKHSQLMDKFEELAQSHRVEIVAHIGDSGEYEIPDVRQILYDRKLDAES